MTESSKRDMQQQLFPGMSAKELRDEAIARVANNAGHSWHTQAMNVFHTLPASSEFTGEELRLECEKNDVHPHHHNAWGAYIMHLKRNGLIASTGKYRNMQTAKSHARRTEIYRKV